MNRDLFWLSDEQFVRILPHLPRNTRGNGGISADRPTAASSNQSCVELRGKRVGLRDRRRLEFRG